MLAASKGGLPKLAERPVWKPRDMGEGGQPREDTRPDTWGRMEERPGEANTAGQGEESNFAGKGEGLRQESGGAAGQEGAPLRLGGLGNAPGGTDRRSPRGQRGGRHLPGKKVSLQASLEQTIH